MFDVFCHFNLLIMKSCMPYYTRLIACNFRKHKKAAMIHSHSCFYAEKNCAAYIFSIAKLFPFLWENNFVLTLTRRAGLSLYRKGAATG